MQALLRKHKPNSIEDLTADNALYRPGPMDAKVDDPDNPNFGKTMMEVYVDRASGLVPVEYDHPLLEQVQRDTYGVFVYQEQVMNASVVLANYTLPEADELRKVVGKKLMDKMPIQHEKFVKGCLNNPLFIEGCEEMGKDAKEVAEMIWKQIETFGRYGFNKSHSTSYADLAYRAMWLKVHYPAHFMSAVLTSWMGAKIEDLVPYLNECRRMGIKILPPDVNHSSAVFEVSRDGKGIHFGLTGIKGVGEKAVENILEIKKHHAINSLVDFISLTNSSVNKTVVSSLIKCGAFDFLGFNRRTLLQMAEDLIEINSKIRTKIANNAKRKNPISDISSFYDPLYSYTPPVDLEEFSTAELCQMERELTGFYMAHHPLDGFVEYIKAKATHTSIDINKGILANAHDLEIDEQFGQLYERDLNPSEPIYVPIPKGQTVITGGVIKQLNPITIQSGRNKGKQMATFIIEDAYQGDIRCTAFADVFTKYRNTIRDGNVIFIKGHIDYYRDTAQINVVEAKEISADIAKKYRISDVEKQLAEIEEQINNAEEILEILGTDDYNMIGAVCDELFSLYEQRDALKKLANKEAFIA
jgi:DNA polymerase-3 subunit alpha